MASAQGFSAEDAFPHLPEILRVKKESQHEVSQQSSLRLKEDSWLVLGWENTGLRSRTRAEGLGF